jgi:hypothetical protein
MYSLRVPPSDHVDGRYIYCTKVLADDIDQHHGAIDPIQPLC